MRADRKTWMLAGALLLAAGTQAELRAAEAGGNEAQAASRTEPAAASEAGGKAATETEVKSEQGKRAKVTVRGFGWLKNRELAQTLNLLLGDGAKRSTFDAGFIEDASLVLNSELVEAGFFAAAVKASWTDASGGRGSAMLDAALSQPLPRPLAVRELRLEAAPGVRAVVRSVKIEGLHEIEPKAAEAFFRPGSGLYTPAEVRAWSQARARRAAEQLREALRARGFAEAKVEIADTALDREVGEVKLTVKVDEGPRWRVKGWRAEVEGGGELEGGVPAKLVGEAWSRSLASDAAQAVRRKYFEKGHAEVRVAWRAEPAELEEGAKERAVTAVAQVEPGPAWRIGDVRFKGVKKTRQGLLETRVRELKPGAPYDPTTIDEARLRLARLGVFRRLEVSGARREGSAAAPDGSGVADGPETRDVLFRVQEEAGWQASWLIGYGSYERIRGVVDLSRTNLWGLAHRDRVEVGQSMKASRGEYRYTVPTLFHDTVEGSARLFGLRREEQSFTRLEYGAALEAGREVPWIEARGTAGLSYEVLRADDVELGVSSDEVTETAVAAVNLGLSRDRRDNPIRPRRGYRWSVQSETALPELGGDVRYERMELAWSWHRPLGEDRWAHVGVSQGFISGGGDDVPVNKLFFPGGESSIRGYAEGEATQRDAGGRFVGVRSAWLVNLELEQVITGRWTVVLFSDTLGTAVEIDQWPDDEVLTSLGLGLRYQSPIGPIRLEYGRNLNRRPDDPSGTVHFSIGFPF